MRKLLKIIFVILTMPVALAAIGSVLIVGVIFMLVSGLYERVLGVRLEDVLKAGKRRKQNEK